ncbi:MAG: hypothetical protein ACFFA6_04490 [Promethearchaeota archaeon]
MNICFIDKDVFITIKIALNRSSILLSAESSVEDTKAAKDMIQTFEEIILSM